MGLHNTTLAGTIALLPLQMRAPMSEVLEWLTELQTARNGGELPKRFRRNPRQKIVGTVPAQFADAARALNIGYGGLTRKWGVPLWQDAQPVGAVAGSSSEVLCDPAGVDLRPESLGLLWQDPTTFEVVEIDTVLSDRITLLSNTSVSMGNAVLLPLRTGKMLSKIERDTTGYNGTLKVTYDVGDNLDLNPAAPAQFLGNDIYFDPHLLSGGEISEDLQTLRDVVDFDTGLIDTWAPWLNNRIGRAYGIVCEDRASAWAFRQWLHRRGGRWRPFWTPTFEADLRPSGSGTVTNVLTVHDQNYSTFGVPRLHIAVEDSAGNWHPRTVTTFEPAGGLVDLTLSSALNLPLDSIRRVSYLGLKRLDADRIEMRWVGNNVCQTNLRIMEIAP